MTAGQNDGFSFLNRTCSLRGRGGGLCWFKQQNGLKPFEGTKSVHRETHFNGKLPVKHSHSATPMETTNQVKEGIKGYIRLRLEFWILCPEWRRMRIQVTSMHTVTSNKISPTWYCSWHCKQRHYQSPFAENTGLSSALPSDIRTFQRKLSLEHQEWSAQTSANILLSKSPEARLFYVDPKHAPWLSPGHMWNDLKGTTRLKASFHDNSISSEELYKISYGGISGV